MLRLELLSLKKFVLSTASRVPSALSKSQTSSCKSHLGRTFARDISFSPFIHPSFSGARIPTTLPEDPRLWERVVWSVPVRVPPDCAAFRAAVPRATRLALLASLGGGHLVLLGSYSRLTVPLACDWSDSRGLSFFTQWCFGCSSGKRVFHCLFFFVFTHIKTPSN